MSQFGEVLTAMVTPFNDDLEVNYEAAADLANYLVENGSDGILVLGTTGEVPTLTKEEKLKLVKVVLKAVGQKAQVVVGTASYSTQDSIEMTKKVSELEVDGVMLVGPYYNKPPQSGLYNHFKEVAQVTDLPVMLYNVPGRTSKNIEPQTIADLAKIDNIVAVKEASGDVQQAAEINRLTAADFDVYSGDDGMTLPILSIGGSGIVSVAAHLVGKQIKEMVGLYKKGQVEEAAQLNAKLLPIFQKIFITTNPIPIKKALNLLGKNVGSLRAPLIEANQEQEKILKLLLEDYNLL